MIRIQESTIKQAMQFVMDEFISVHLSSKDKDLLEFDDSKQWRTENPTTGKIRLKAYPQCKEAWVLVKFSEVKNPNYGTSIVRQQHKTIRSVDEFQEFFGIKPIKNFTEDMIIICSWDKQTQRNKNTADRFDETTPDFYMYTTHIKTNIPEMINRLIRIKQAMDKLGVGNESKLYNLPYKLTELDKRK